MGVLFAMFGVIYAAAGDATSFIWRKFGAGRLRWDQQRECISLISRCQYLHCYDSRFGVGCAVDALLLIHITTGAPGKLDPAAFGIVCAQCYSGV